jgi:hypothetical protein
MSELTLQSTTITQTAEGVRVQVLFADNPKVDEASEAVQIDLPVEIEEHRPLFEYQAAALRCARSVIDLQMSEIQRLADHRIS